MVGITGEAEPAGNLFADDRIQFYLRHRAIIREWAAIERDLAAATHELMVGLLSDIDVAVRDVDPEAIVSGTALDGSWPRIVSVRPVWPQSSSGEALVAVTLEWTPKVDPSGGAMPYYGVRVTGDEDAGKAIRDALRPLVTGSEAAAAGFKAASYPWWPIQQRLLASPDWWNDIEAFRLDCVTRMLTAWRVLAPLVDTAVLTAGDRSEI